MNKFANKLSVRYATAMHQYLEHQEEALLQQAYELGRSAIAGGLGILDLARIHQETVIILMSSAIFQATHTQTLKAAEGFFFETLSPFEAAYRGFGEANIRLQQLNAALAQRNEDLEREINVRRRTENALRDSEASLRELSQKILHIQEEERTRISRELHDEVGQSLTAVNVDLAMLKKEAPAGDRFERKITDAQNQVAQTMNCVHRFARELRPSILDDLGLVPALRSYAHSFAERTGIRIAFHASALAERLNRDSKTVVFRVTQESLTNVAKHARATQVQLSVKSLAAGVRVTIKDNGKAVAAQKKLSNQGTKRLGLLGMQERVRLVNGRFAVVSSPGKGTAVTVDIPYQAVGANGGVPAESGLQNGRLAPA